MIVWMALGLLLLTGCATSAPLPPAPSEDWVKPGASTAGLAQDSHECQEEAIYPSYPPGPYSVDMPQTELHTDPHVYTACMEQRGYQLKQSQ